MDLVYLQQFESTDINTCFSMHTENLLPLENENIHKWSNKPPPKKHTQWGGIWVGGWGWGGSSAGRVSGWKARRNTDTGLIHRCGKGFFSQSQVPVQTLVLLIQPHFVHVKNPRQWQPYCCLQKWKYYTHWQEWIALLLRLLHSGKQPKFPERD